MNKLSLMLVALLGISNASFAQDDAEAEFETNILDLTWGGIAMSDGNDAAQPWSKWSINLVDGTAAYGWSSSEDIKFPHELNFELAGSGTITSFVVDARLKKILRQDGTHSQEGDGSSVRNFELQGSLEGPDGPFFTIVQGEADKDQYNRYVLEQPIQARWLKLVIKSNWNGGGLTRLSELEAYGELDERGAAGVDDVSGVYAQEYGNIILRQDGHEIFGCYGGGYGQLRGQIYGRMMRLSWFSQFDENIGNATFAATDNKIYGYWYGQNNITGTSWNSEKIGELGDTPLGDCQLAIYPSNVDAP